MSRFAASLITSALLLTGAARPLSAQSSNPCTGARAAVEISGVTVDEMIVKSQGTWRAEGSAVGVMLEYRLDSDRAQSETRTTATGPWSFTFDYSNEFKKCGRHTLRVYAFPVVKDGDRLVHCLGQGQSTPSPFSIACEARVKIEHCDWECSDQEPPGCTGICTGSARSGGAPGLVAFQGLNDKDYKTVEGPPTGPWSWSVICNAGERVSFKVRDQLGIGAWSNVAERLCGAP